MRAAIYARVSTDEQADNGTGLAEQLDGCRAYAKLHDDWEVSGEFLDEGVSGTLEHRPGLDALLAACRAGSVDVVLIHRLTRLARNTRVALNLLYEFTEAGSNVVSVKENIDTTTPAGKAQQGMLLVFAEFDRDSIVEQTSAGLRQRVRQGRWPGGPAPYGFQVEKSDGGSVLAPHPVDAETLRVAADLIANQGLSTWEAAAELNTLGLVPRRAERWDHVNLRRILSDPRYAGVWLYKTKRHGDIELEVPRLIPEPTWDRLQAKLAATSTGPKTAHAYYLLSRGMLRSACGSVYAGLRRRDRGYRQYRCRNSRPEAAVRCDCRRLRADEVEWWLWDSICVLLWDPEVVTKLADDYFGISEAEGADAPARLAKVQAEIAATEQALGRASATLLASGAGAGVIRQANSTLDAQLTQMRAIEQQLVERVERAVGSRTQAEGLAELAKVARDRLTVLSDLERREVLDLLEVQVEVTGWRECEHCGGSGKVKGGSGGFPCLRCHQTRRVPELVVTGAFTDRLLASDVWDQEGGVSRRSTWSRR